MTDVIKHMRDRFLAWRLPEDFAPDGGIEFSQRGPHGPTGTNLFTAVQAEAMIRHMLECAPAASQPEAEPVAWRFVLEQYRDDLCEGFCKEDHWSDAGHSHPDMQRDCGGCRAAAALLAHLTPAPVVPADGLVEAMREAIDLLKERKHGSPARSPGHNARLVLEDALRAHQPAAPVSGVTVREAGWRPIETAPHEELVVLGWQEDGVWKQEIALASAGKRLPNGYSNRWMHGRATHWMPLPEPPVFSALEGK